MKASKQASKQSASQSGRPSAAVTLFPCTWQCAAGTSIVKEACHQSAAHRLWCCCCYAKNGCWCIWGRIITSWIARPSHYVRCPHSSSSPPVFPFLVGRCPPRPIFFFFPFDKRNPIRISRTRHLRGVVFMPCFLGVFALHPFVGIGTLFIRLPIANTNNFYTIWCCWPAKQCEEFVLLPSVSPCHEHVKNTHTHKKHMLAPFWTHFLSIPLVCPSPLVCCLPHFFHN